MNLEDRAAAEADTHLEIALLNQQISAQQNIGAVSATFCEECGNLIPEARRVAVPGVRFCVGCQMAFEHQNRLYR